MTSKCFLQYIAGYTVAYFWRYPIRSRVTKASALEFTYNTVHNYGMDSKHSIIKGLHCSHMLDNCNEASHTEKNNNNKKGKWVWQRNATITVVVHGLQSLPPSPKRAERKGRRRPFREAGSGHKQWNTVSCVDTFSIISKFSAQNSKI